MEKRKEKFPTAWLSKQQKEILKIVGSGSRPISRTRNISKDVAIKFNVDGSRAMIRPSRQEKIEDVKKRVKSGEMSPEQGSMIVNMYGMIHRKDKTNMLLENKHSASVSRSLKRLTERDLIVPYDSVRYRYHKKNGEFVNEIIGSTKATRPWHNKPLYTLSEKGIAWSNSNIKNFDDTKAKEFIKEEKEREKAREIRKKEIALKKAKK